MYSLSVRRYIAVPSVVAHAVGIAGGVRSIRLHGLNLPPMHTAMAWCANCGGVGLQSPDYALSNQCVWAWGVP